MNEISRRIDAIISSRARWTAEQLNTLHACRPGHPLGNTMQWRNAVWVVGNLVSQSDGKWLARQAADEGERETSFVLLNEAMREGAEMAEKTVDLLCYIVNNPHANEPFYREVLISNQLYSRHLYRMRAHYQRASGMCSEDLS